MEITNSTHFDNSFIPSIWAHQQSDNRFVLRHFATTNSNNDNGSTPIMIFRSEIRNNLNLNAPTGGFFPWGESGSNVINRPVFGWENGDTQLMRIMANENIGIGTNSPTALLDINGIMRIRNIPIVNTDTYVLTTDNSGNVRKKLASSIGPGGKVFVSDAKNIKDVNLIENPLEIIMGLSGKTYTDSNDNIETINNKQYGLIAQDVEKVINTIVSTSDEGIKTVSYVEIIPILIEAVKEQQKQIILLNEQLLIKNSNIPSLNNFTNTFIKSISPNPSAENIIVLLCIEKGIENARLIVSDFNGKNVFSLTIDDREDNINKTLQKNNFSSGTYLISLIVNEKVVDTKKIIFN